jgi:hypothetical protein
LFGVVPTVFTAWFWPVFFRREFKELPKLRLFSHYDLVTEPAVKNQFKMLLNDKEYYDTRLKELREHIPIFTTDQALSMLEQVLTEL